MVQNTLLTFLCSKRPEKVYGSSSTLAAESRQEQDSGRNAALFRSRQRQALLTPHAASTSTAFWPVLLLRTLQSTDSPGQGDRCDPGLRPYTPRREEGQPGLPAPQQGSVAASRLGVAGLRQLPARENFPGIG